MSKKIMLAFVGGLLSIFVLANSAFADFDAIRTVGSSSSTTLKDSFGWNEQPWLYLHLSKEFLNVTASWWESPDPDSQYYFAGTGPGTDSEVWISLDDGQDSNGNDIDWLDVRKLGLWNINASASYADGSSDAGSTDFTVTPEPVSSLLFLVGGASLAAARLRKRKSSS